MRATVRLRPLTNATGAFAPVAFPWRGGPTASRPSRGRHHPSRRGRSSRRCRRRRPSRGRSSTSRGPSCRRHRRGRGRPSRCRDRSCRRRGSAGAGAARVVGVLGLVARAADVLAARGRRRAGARAVVLGALVAGAARVVGVLGLVARAAHVVAAGSGLTRGRPVARSSRSACWSFRRRRPLRRRRCRRRARRESRGSERASQWWTWTLLWSRITVLRG